MSIPTVAYFADLPTAVPPNIDSQYLVTNDSGTGPGVRTPSGLYQRINTTGVLSIDWQYWGNTDPYGSVTLASLGAQAAITFGTGVLTALGVNIGSAGAPVLFGGALGTPASGTLTNCTFPTLNQSTTGSAAKWTTARNLAGNSVDGSTNVAFSNKFVVQGTADAGLSGPQFLGALGTGIIKNTTTTGVLSIAVAGDFPALPYAPSSGIALSALATQANYTVLGNISGGSAVPSALTGANVCTICGLAPTDTPTFAGITLPAQTAHTFFSGPSSGASSSPAFRALVAADIPALSYQTPITFGTGVLTSLGVNVGSSGAPVLFNGALGTPTSGTLTNCTFPTLNQNTTGSAAKWTTSQNLAGNSVDGSAAVAFANKFIVQGTADAGLSGPQFLGALGTGILKNTTTTGVLSIAVPADFPTLNQNTSGTAAGLSATLAVTSGGTGLASIASGKMLYASALNTFAALSTGNSLAITGGVLDTIQDIRTSANPVFSGLTAVGIIPQTTLNSTGTSPGENPQSNFSIASTLKWAMGCNNNSGGSGFNFFFYNAGSAVSALELDFTTNNANFYAGIKTAAPSGGTAQPWKLGGYTAGVAVQAGKVRVEINGTPYDLLTA